MIKKTESFWVYILLCSNDAYYTGYTHNLEKRFALHCEGKAAKYTRSFKPIKIAASWQFSCTSGEAMRIEGLIKKMARAKKEQLIQNPKDLSQHITLEFV